MTTLKVKSLHMPTGDLGPENPLPRFRDAEQDKAPSIRADVPEEDRRYIGWRAGYRVLPYRLQDNYKIEPRPAELMSVVLENETLKAIFLPEVGGRLISLVHKPTDRELLDRNPAFRPANLALRRAWYSGGIEWNSSQPGHHYLTCSPVFAARAVGPGGDPVLRIYEWDRVKRFPWQVDFHLPSGSPFLFARMRLVNPHDEVLPMYWWTNIAVPQADDVRVLAPATKTLRFTIGSDLHLLDLVHGEGFYSTYSKNVQGSRDNFFRMANDQRPWITALDGAGRGLFQASTPRLCGRKMFFWGMHPGGRHWQERLSGPGRSYIEIQAGLARTQIGTVPMPALAEWTWTEAFGLLEADAKRVHSEDWNDAWGAAGEALDGILPVGELDSRDRELAAVTTRPPEEILLQASGWAALERRRLAASGAPDRIPAELVFDEKTMGPEQEPWLALLDSGTLPQQPTAAADLGEWMVQPEWAELLEKSIAAGDGDHWLSWLHLGNARAEALDPAGAREAWNKSLERQRSAWALRNLAVLETQAGNHAAACDLLLQAWQTGPAIAPLAVEYVRALNANGEFPATHEFLASLPDDMREDEHLTLIGAKAALETGHIEEVPPIFEREFASVREGETKLTDLWFEYHGRRIAAAEGLELDDQLRARVREELPAPYKLDFRQRVNE